MKELISKLYITEGCVGDIEHNKYVDILVKDIPENDLNKIILTNFQGNWKTGRWIFNVYTKDELQKLNVIMRTKVEDTKIKRMAKLLNHFCRGSHWNVIFNSNKIEKWTNIFHDYITKGNNNG